MHITIKNKVYHNKDGDYEALKDLDITINHTGFIAIVGESGSGKTTLLNIIGGEDKDYNGAFTELHQVSYVKQEIELLECFYVKSHISMICKDQKRMSELCDLLQISDLLHKKIKHLSLGQKRRVQLACALLKPTSYLICDEPTASLDQENADIIFHALKQLSDEICVIVVTHDEKKAQLLSDRIIHIEDGRIIGDQIIKEKQQIETMTAHTHWKQTNSLVLAGGILYSRFLETLFYICLCALITVSMIGGVQFFRHVDADQQYRDMWYSGDNVLMSEPKTIIDEKYSVYDIYYKQHLNDIKQASDQVIGYEWGWNADLYNYFPTEQDLKDGYDYRKFFVEAFRYVELSDGYINYPSPFLPTVSDQSYPYDPNSARIFQMFDFSSLSLSEGAYPQQEREVLVDLDYAQYLAARAGCSISELIGREMKFYTAANDEQAYEATAYRAVITGITDLISQTGHRIYAAAGDYDDFLYEAYDMRTKDPGHVFLNIVSKDGSDDTLSVVSSVLGSDQVSFIKGSEYLAPLQNQQAYRNPTQFYVYAVMIYILLLTVFIMSEILLQKRNQKEQRILHRYGYSYRKVRMLMISLIYGIVCCLLIAAHTEVNALLQDGFFQVTIVHIAVSCLINYLLCAVSILMLSKKQHIGV